MRAYLIALACLAMLAGCDRQRQEHTVTIPGNGGTMTVSGNGQNFTVKDANGNQSVTVNSGGVAAAVLPGFVSVFPGAKIDSSVVGVGAKGNGGTVILETSASPADVIAYYKQKSSAAGFGETMNMATGGTTMFTASSKDSKKTVEVVASTSNGATHAQVIWSGE
ncbi:MAG TPA: hypothetical protein VII49_07920 [Rhizomicrobium sp.]